MEEHGWDWALALGTSSLIVRRSMVGARALALIDFQYNRDGELSGQEPWSSLHNYIFFLLSLPRSITLTDYPR